MNSFNFYKALREKMKKEVKVLSLIKTTVDEKGEEFMVPFQILLRSFSFARTRCCWPTRANGIRRSCHSALILQIYLF